MIRANEGLKSELLRTALEQALQQPKPQTIAALEALLLKHGGLPGLRPNLKLAAAFGADIGPASGAVLALLQPWADDIAAPDTPRAFLPVAAAHGFAHYIRARGQDSRDTEQGWRALQLLAADERAPVRVGTLEALVQLAMRDTYADELLTRASFWLDESDRELSYGAVATALDALTEPRVLPNLHGHEALFELLTRAIAAIVDAPRSAQRSDARRRLLRSFGTVLPQLLATLRDARPWFIAVCERAEDPELRAALSSALQRLPELSNAPARPIVDELRAALESTQKPVRDAARVRPGTGRGRRSRPLR